MLLNHFIADKTIIINKLISLIKNKNVNKYILRNGSHFELLREWLLQHWASEGQAHGWERALPGWLRQVLEQAGQVAQLWQPLLEEYPELDHFGTDSLCWLAIQCAATRWVEFEAAVPPQVRGPGDFEQYEESGVLPGDVYELAVEVTGADCTQ